MLFSDIMNVSSADEVEIIISDIDHMPVGRFYRVWDPENTVEKRLQGARLNAEMALRGADAEVHLISVKECRENCLQLFVTVDPQVFKKECEFWGVSWNWVRMGDDIDAKKISGYAYHA